MKTFKTDQLCFVNTPGRCNGAQVRFHQAGATVADNDVVEVRFCEPRGPYAIGAVASYLARDLLVALEPGQHVAYAPEYLRANNADPREYGRHARVVKRLEGTIVSLEWADRMGPQTDTTEHLVVLPQTTVSK